MPRRDEPATGAWRWFNPRTMRGLGLALLLVVILVLFYLGGPALRGREDADAVAPSIDAPAQDARV